MSRIGPAILALQVGLWASAWGATRAIGPGDDLARAAARLGPGDTLILRDGVYRSSIAPARSGVEGRLITIRAQNDGGAVIDGERERAPVVISGQDYIVIEGLVARNSPNRSGTGVYSIRGSHNILRRCTGYDAGNTQNCGVFNVAYPESQDNLLEDCAAWGTGRKMFCFWHSSHNTMRRCFANWTRWDGSYLNGSNLQFYGSSNCIMENCIGYGPVPAWWSVSMFVQRGSPACVGNRILGTIAIRAGMNRDGTPKEYNRPRGMTPVGFRPSGLQIAQSGGRENRDCVFRDCFSWGNLGPGLGVGGDVMNLTIDHVTVKGNGVNLVLGRPDEVTITNSYIEGTKYRGPGARLTHRYVDGELTDEPLWPWPMEERIKKEMGISVTEEITKIIGVRVPSGPKKLAAPPEPRPKPKPRPRPTAGALDRFGALLRTRVTEELAEGRRPRFSVAAFQQRFEIVAMDEAGTLRLKGPVMTVDLEWPRLMISDRRSLALAVLREETPLDHALAAFYFIADGDERGASDHLDKSGDAAEEVSGSFTDMPVREVAADKPAATVPNGSPGGAARSDDRPPPAPPAPARPTDSVEAQKLFERGESLFIEGEQGKAVEVFRRLVEGHPGSDSARKAQEYLEMLE